jgi:predicted DNA-binding transcriptional regulator YafY
MYIPGMRASRLVRLLLLLQTRGQLTATELASTLGVSVRTVHRDVEALAEAGVPVEAVRGPAGGYRVAGGYRTRLTGLTGDEAEALFAGPAAELGLGGVFADARLKLLAALPRELQERAERSERLFHLDTRGWFKSEDKVPHLATVADGLWRGRRLRIRYREGRRVVQRTIDPLGLVLKSGAWYLVAHRTAGMRVYRVSRIASVRVLADAAARPAEFDLGRFWTQWSDEFERSRPRVDVVVRATPRGVQALRWLARVARVEEDRVVAGFERIEDAVGAMLGLGAEVEVLEPDEVRKRVRDAAHATAALYA